MGTLIGLDDTDARDVGMCTTYVGSVIADALVDDGYAVGRRYLIRLNPAVSYKTRGNAAVAIATDAPVETAFELASTSVEELAVLDDPDTNPGVAVVRSTRVAALRSHTWEAVRGFVDTAVTVDRLRSVDARVWSAGNGRGLIGATAALGAPAAFADWTVEFIGYRPRQRYGTDRRVDHETAFEADRATYPLTWDTVDRGEDTVVCAPRTPGPVLFGLRGAYPEAVIHAADLLEHEPLERTALFVTNQGTDAHLRPGTPASVRDGGSYLVNGMVDTSVETRRGGHVHLTIAGGDGRLPCVAFEPTKRFREHVRQLRRGDRVTVCGEVSEGTLKLEKFALRRPRTFIRSVPRCDDCDRSMESAGTDQGYRCRTCSNTAVSRVTRSVVRRIEPGWYEVPPVARRHLARPLCRGGFNGQCHPSR